MKLYEDRLIYHGVGGTRAAENLRLILGELHVANVRAQVTHSLFTDIENYKILKSVPHQEAAANTTLRIKYETLQMPLFN
jgi:NAD(P)H-dependent FMN reductase